MQKSHQVEVANVTRGTVLGSEIRIAPPHDFADSLSGVVTM